MRLLLLISFLLSLPISLSAQHLRAGLMYTDIYNAPFIENQTPKWYYSLGFSVSIDPPDWAPFFLQYETRYAEKGYKTQIQDGSAVHDFQLDFHYLYHALSAGYQLFPNIAPYVGLEAGMLLRANLITATDRIHLQDTYRQADLGLLAGVQLFRNSKVSADLRVAGSLLPLLRYESFDNFGNPTGRIRGLNHLTLEAVAMLRLFKFQYQK